LRKQTTKLLKVHQIHGIDALIAKKKNLKHFGPLKQSIKTTRYSTEEADEISIPVLAIEYKYLEACF